MLAKRKEKKVKNKLKKIQLISNQKPLFNPSQALNKNLNVLHFTSKRKGIYSSKFSQRI
jgi:hypothetical protein